MKHCTCTYSQLKWEPVKYETLYMYILTAQVGTNETLYMYILIAQVGTNEIRNTVHVCTHSSSGDQ